LDEERGQQATNVTLVDILVVKIIVGDQGRLRFSRELNVFDDGRANRQYELLRAKHTGDHIPENALSGASYTCGKESVTKKAKKTREAYDCHKSIIKNRSSSIL
jgi:hypothetical protein